MAYTATQLINRAYYLSGIVARELQTVSGTQIQDGLYLLNALLDFKSAQTNLIPYYTHYEFNLIPGQEEYFIEGLYEIDTVTFNLGVIRYPMTRLNRMDYFGAGRVDAINSLPFSWHSERTMGGLNLYVYFQPDNDYICKIMGKFALTDVELNTDLSQFYDNFYIEYLRYNLAKYICQEYRRPFPPEHQQQIDVMERNLSYLSPPDLSVIKIRLIGNDRSINWPQNNIGKGWYPS